MRRLLHRSSKQDCGSSLLFFAVAVIPLVSFALFIGVDLAKYYAESQAVQKAVDTAALQGFRMLPYKEDARRAVEAHLNAHYASQFSSGDAALVLNVTGDSIYVDFSSKASLAFGPLTQIISGQGESFLKIRQLSVARGVPFDVFIAIDSSAAYLSPPISGGASWSGLLPAEFFQNSHKFYLEDGVEVPDILSTEQCFNPGFSALKRAAIKSYYYFSNFDRDHVGLGVFPGYGLTTDEIRSVVSRATPQQSGGEANFIDYNGLQRGDSYCAAAAQYETRTPDYQFPLKPPHFSDWEPLEDPGVGMILPPHWNFNPAYAGALRAREAIWSLSTREGPPADFPRLIEDVVARLIGSPENPLRENLARTPEKVAFIFMGDLPSASGFRWVPGAEPATTLIAQSIDGIRSLVRVQGVNAALRLRLVFVLFDHPGTSANPIGPFIESFKSMLREASYTDGAPTPELSIDVVYSPGPDYLEHAVVPQLIVGQRNAVLSR